MHPQRPKLVEQVWRELNDGIDTHRWRGWLPQERALAGELNVSRSTLRMALQRLRTEGRLESLHSRGNRILFQKSGGRARVARPVTVNLVLPYATETMPQSSVIWVENLRAQLMSRGCHLGVIHTRVCYMKRPDRAIEELVRRNPADCWLVRLATLPFQQWLEKHDVPAILIGGAAPGVRLPCIDLNHRALIQHAMGLVVAAGHRRIALLTDREHVADERESERGFSAVANASRRHPDLQATIARFEGGIPGLVRQLDGMLRQRNRPTALLVPNAIYCLTIWSHLGSRGLRVPDDMSVVAHVGTIDLSYLRPEPTRYRLNMSLYVQKILRAVLAKIAGGDIAEEVQILPEFVRGASLGPPRSVLSGGMTPGTVSRIPFEPSMMAVA